MNTLMAMEDWIALPIGQQPDDDSYSIEAICMTQAHIDMLDASVVRPEGTIIPQLRLYGGVEVKLIPEGAGCFSIWRRQARAYFTNLPEPYVRDEADLAPERRGYQAWLDEVLDIQGGS